MMRLRNTAHRKAHGLAVVEFAMVLPILLVIMFGVVDFGRAILVQQVMINLSREAANLASRGTELQDVTNAIQVSSAPLNMTNNGYIIVTEVTRGENGNLSITNQHAQGGVARASRIGQGNGNAAVLPASDSNIPLAGQNMYVAEVFYRSPAITPLGELVNINIGEIFYDSAFF